MKTLQNQQNIVICNREYKSFYFSKAEACSSKAYAMVFYFKLSFLYSFSVCFSFFANTSLDYSSTVDFTSGSLTVLWATLFWEFCH